MQLREMNFQGSGFYDQAVQDKRIVRGAVAASLLLHVVFVAATWKIPLKPRPEDFAVRDDTQDIEVILESWDPPGAQSDAPTTYVSVPERHAVEEAPEEPDYLALHHSLASDNKLGDAEQPSADQEKKFNSVAIQKEDQSGAGGVEFSQQPLPEKKPATSQSESATDGRGEAEKENDQQDVLGDWALPQFELQPADENNGEKSEDQNEDNPELENWWGGRSNPSILKPGEDGASGDRGFDFNQEASGSVTSGVVVEGEYKLNTVQWDWAPWIQVFGNELHRHWSPPYAYRYGLLSGTTVIRLVVEKDGRPSSMEILEEDGHESLHSASVAALKAFVPYAALPATFPEENLVITLSLHYPAFRR